MYQEIRKLSYALIAALIIFGGLFAFPNDKAQAAVGINKKINFQGKVTNTDGTNVANASYNFLFCVYTVASPATACTAGANNDAVWRESKNITVTDGIFQTNLGDTTAFAALIDFNSDNIYLGINFNSNGQMTPLVQFTASPYSLNSDLLDGGDWTIPGTIGSTTQNTGNFTTLNADSISTDTGGISIAANQSYGGAGAVTLSSTTNGLTLDSGNNTLTIAASDTSLTASGVTTLTLAANTKITNASGNINLEAAAAGTANIQIGDGGATSGTPDLLVLDIGSAEPAGTIGAMYYSTALNKFRCYQVSAWADCIGVGGGGYSTIVDDANGTLTQRSTLSFLGSGVACIDNGGQTECTIASGGAGPWTDGTGISYLTDTAEDLAIGASTLAAPFSVDVSTNTVRVGSGSTANAKIDMYASDGDTGSITYTENDTWAFEGGRVGIGTQNVTGATERLLQVGSETNRGNSVTYGEVTTKGLRDIVPLADIKDIYLYDTTADSDGGRWIDWASTDKLSWYTEALDDGPSDPCNIATDDRCYTAHFPRKAILAVTGSAFYIFDSTSNSMWMKFDQNAAGYALGIDVNNTPSSITALNGVIYIGMKGGAASDGTKGTNGLYAFDFTTDRMWYYDDIDRSGADVGMGSRNGTVVYNSDNNTAFDLATAGTIAGWKTVNDVSAAVIQFSASAISATSNPGNGLSMIALATDSGLTTINLSNQKVLQYSDATDNDYNSVAITRTAKLYGLNETLGQAELWTTIDIDQISEINGGPNKFWDETAAPGLSKVAPTILVDAPDALEVVERGSLSDAGTLSTAALAGSSDLIYVGTNQGLTEIHDNGTPTMGWVKYFNTTRQTPILPTAIKRYLPMDEASGDLNDASIQGAAGANNRTMMPKGTPTYGVNGVRGKGIGLNGTSSFFCSDNNGAACAADTIDNRTTTAWTITTWFKHSATISGFDMLYNRCYNTTPAQAVGCSAIFMNSTGTMSATIDDDATWTNGTATTYDQYATSTQTYNDNQWHFATLQRTNASGILFSIDGKAITLGGAAPTLTMDASQITAIGADCSVGAACVTGANFWDGAVDDFTFSNSTTTIAGSTAVQMRRLYNDARPLANKKVINVTDATTATSTTIGDSGETWIPNEFNGMVMEITGSTDADCVGLTRRVVANTATVITFNPAVPASCAMDISADFQVDPEALYGASDSVKAVGITGETPMGEARQMCVGTNGTTDTGGVTCYNHQAGPNIVADVYHSGAGQADDGGSDWTGTDYDDIQSIDISGRAMVFGSLGHMWTETQDVRLGQGLDYLANKLFDVRNTILNLGNVTLAGSGSSEVGLTGGADLAEYYRSSEILKAGDIVATGDDGEDSVKKTSAAYQKDIIGIVATAPGMILGTQEENSYPIALAGRVPINVTTENGTIFKGDQITSSSTSGYGMVAIESGRVIGTVLEDPDTAAFEDCLVDLGLPIGTKCGQVEVFVNLMDFSGMKMEDLMSKKGYDTLAQNSEFSELFASANTQDIVSQETGEVFQSQWTDIFKAANTLGFLKKLNDPATGMNMSSEILTKNINASGQVVSPLIVTDTLIAKHIKAESIEGLEFIQTGIDSANSAAVANAGQVKNLGQQLAELQSSVKTLSEQNENVDESLATVEGLLVEKDAEFKGFAIFRSMVSFIDRVIFRNKVEFEGEVMFNKDTAGYAVIKEGTDTVGIEFENEYAFVPIVNASLSLQSIEDEELRKSAEQLLLVSDVKFIITNVTTKGFEIRISQKAISETPFSWQTIAIRNAKTFESKIPLLAGDKKEIFQETRNDTPEIEASSSAVENTVLTEQDETFQARDIQTVSISTAAQITEPETVIQE